MLIPYSILIAIAGFTLLAGSICIHQARRLSCQRQILSALNMELAAAFQCLNAQNTPPPSGSPADGKTEPGSMTPVESGAGSYSHVAVLTRRGLDADAIAEILDVSPNIAKQMVALSEVARKRQKN